MKDFRAQPYPVNATEPLEGRAPDFQEHGRQGAKAEGDGLHDSVSERSPAKVFNDACSGFKESLYQIWDVLEGVGNGGSHGLEALPDSGHGVLAQTEPVERRENVVNGAENFGNVRHDNRDGANNPHSQRCDNADASRQQFRGVIVYHSRDIADNRGNGGNDNGYAVRQPPRQIQSEADCAVNEASGVLPYGRAQSQYHIQPRCHKRGKVRLKILSEVRHNAYGGIRQDWEAVQDSLR